MGSYDVNNPNSIKKTYLKTNKGKSLTNFDIICKLESIKHQLIKIKSQI